MNSHLKYYMSDQYIKVSDYIKDVHDNLYEVRLMQDSNSIFLLDISRGLLLSESDSLCRFRKWFPVTVGEKTLFDI